MISYQADLKRYLYNTLMVVKVFTDGGCVGNGKANCTSGIGVYFPQEDIRISSTSEDACKKYNIDFQKINSNNVGELLAIYVALCEGLKIEDDMIIYSDSMYCINSLTNWYKKWDNNNWMTTNNTKVKNAYYIRKILEMKKKFKSVFFIHVRSHKTEPADKNSDEFFMWNGNDVADQLAISWKK